MTYSVAADRPDELPKNDKREIRGWMMYDWANSAFTTTVVAALFGPYLTALARTAAEDTDGVLFRFLGLTVTDESLYPYCVSLSVLLQVFFLPILGAVADYSHLKKRFMAFFLLFRSLDNLFVLYAHSRNGFMGRLVIYCGKPGLWRVDRVL